jgi:hypothetical protein
LQLKQEESALERADVVLKLLTKRGLIPDKKISDDARRAAQQKRQKDSYHNTELLLKNYRRIAWLVECFPEAIAAELDRPFEAVDELLDGVNIASIFGNRKLEQRTASVEQTRLLLDRINEALTVLKRKPGNGQDLYNLVYLSFIAPEQLSNQEVLYQLNLSPRHYYRLRKEAITILSLRLWSSPDPVIDLWLELIEMGE